MRGLFAWSLLLAACLADRVVLRDGVELHGVVELCGDSVRVHGLTGVRSLHQREVQFLSYGLTPSERLAARLRDGDRLKPEVLRALAQWARGQSLPEALELELWARELDLEQRLDAARSAEELYAVALWAREQRFSAGRIAVCDQLVFAQDIDFFALRRLRGDVFFAGQWMPRARTAQLIGELQHEADQRGSSDAATLLQTIEHTRAESFQLDVELLARQRAALPPLRELSRTCYGRFETPQSRLLSRILAINGR